MTEIQGKSVLVRDRERFELQLELARVRVIRSQLYSGVNFCGKNVCRNIIFICGNFFLRVAGKIAKNFVPHGS